MQCKEITKHFKNRRSLLQVLGVLLVPLHPMMETQTTTKKRIWRLTKSGEKRAKIWTKTNKSMSCYSARGQRISERRNSQITLWRLFTTPLSDLRDRKTLIADVMGEFGAVRLKQHPPRSCVSVVSNSCFKCQHQTWSRWFLFFFSSGDVSLTCGPGRPIPGTPTSPYRQQNTLTVNQSSIFIYKHDDIINGNSHLDSFGTDGALHSRQTWLSLKWQKKKPSSSCAILTAQNLKYIHL